MLQHVLNRSNGQPWERGAALTREKFGDFVLVLRSVEASGNLGLGIPSTCPGVGQQHPFRWSSIGSLLAFFWEPVSDPHAVMPDSRPSVRSHISDEARGRGV